MSTKHGTQNVFPMKSEILQSAFVNKNKRKKNLPMQATSHFWRWTKWEYVEIFEDLSVKLSQATGTTSLYFLPFFFFFFVVVALKSTLIDAVAVNIC